MSDMAKRSVVYDLPGTDAVEVERDVPYADGLAMDLYRPRDAERPPVVVVVAGYPDEGFERFVGCRFKEMGSSVSWGRLLAASGLAAVTYANRDPEADLGALLARLGRDADALGIDAGRTGLWASSGNAPLALSALVRGGDESVRCAALCYGYTLDLGGATAVADASKAFGFANPCAGRTVEDLRGDVPLMLVRAGRDETPGLNDTLGRFVSEALRLNLPISLANLPDAPHAFDLVRDADDSREAIRRVLDFLRACLAP